jgi:hypothetical protein
MQIFIFAINSLVVVKPGITNSQPVSINRTKLPEKNIPSITNAKKSFSK